MSRHHCLHNFQFHVATSYLCHDIFCFPLLFFRLRPQYVATDFFLSNYFPGRDIKVMSRHTFLLLNSFVGRDLNELSRHHSSCQDFSSCFHVATRIACRDINLTLELKTSCDFFCLRRPLLWLHRQILVATSELCRDII